MTTADDMGLTPDAARRYEFSVQRNYRNVCEASLIVQPRGQTAGDA
jgi:hypothetical protein